MATAYTVNKTGNPEIDGLLSGTKWERLVTLVTYSFPDSSNLYSYPEEAKEPSIGFAPAPSQFQTAIDYAVGLIMQYTNAVFLNVATAHADIMVAQTTLRDGPAWAYFPNNSEWSGDIWINPDIEDYSDAAIGNYQFTAALHEFGHAIGLKHPHETSTFIDVLLPQRHDSLEYSVMSYRAYLGAPIDDAGYRVESYGFPATYMANDILALQTLYGANYMTNDGNTVYTWSPSTGQAFIDGVGQFIPGDNLIFQTIWDGGGIDTYDLSNYITGMSLNLDPGAASMFSLSQRADLDWGEGFHYASGNIYNSYLYEDDPRSLIENAYGGAGNDTIKGNSAANELRGGSGNDILEGGAGADVLRGGDGDDTFVFGGNDLRGDVIDGGAGIDTLELNATLTDVSAAGLAGIEIVNGRGFGIQGGEGDDVVPLDAITAANNLAYINGGGGNDRLAGNSGDDTIDGGTGNDLLNGGAGNNTLSGGAGDDRFVFTSAAIGAFTDTITDFGNDQDLIDFSAVVGGISAAVFAEIKSAYAEQSGGNVLISINDYHLVLLGVQLSELEYTDFAFA
ncbi:MAG: M10 family metallopeptidase C-terminal domain-containing protein [Pseudomonadales bacterium]|nr:M10 family metallopeptidase C-terminal domain-containing protein [Pseudomonadales bacterium]